MDTKENNYSKESISLNYAKQDKPRELPYSDPDKYLRHPEQHHDSIVDCLISAVSKPRPPFNAEFISLIKLWRLIASKNTSGEIPGFDLDFLRWLLQDRAREAVIFLRHQSDINVWYALKAIERIANFNIPNSNAIKHQIAMANWVWLKRELTGGLRSELRVDIRKIRRNPIKSPYAK